VFGALVAAGAGVEDQAAPQEYREALVEAVAQECVSFLRPHVFLPLLL
jgi:hypothetical protein